MTKEPDKFGEGVNPMGIASLLSGGTIDLPTTMLGARQGYATSYLTGLGKDMIREHGVSMGLYNVYINSIPQNEFQCEANDCNNQLLEVRCSIMAVMEPDGEWHRITSLAKDPAIYEALLDTNRKAVICLEHRAAAVMLLGQQPKKKGGRIVVPISRGHEIREKKRKRKKRKS